LSQALKLLGRGDSEGAATLLAAIVVAPPAPGVTDEALFRLALLTVPSDLNREQTTVAARLLGRLQREYPNSPWATQAYPLSEMVEELPRRVLTASELRRQLKTLKDLNLSLTRENKELKLNIERLKIIDMELERKIKRP
jgi:hypothetical protein